MFAKLVADSQFTWKIRINITTNRCIPERVARRYPCPGSGSSSTPVFPPRPSRVIVAAGSVPPSSAWKTKVADVQQKPEGGKRYLHKHIQLFCRPSSFLLTISQSIPCSSTTSPLLSMDWVDYIECASWLPHLYSVLGRICCFFLHYSVWVVVVLGR